ncbi:MAG: hypothetical protein Q7U53_17200 [Anaerolineaceae bacterium]|nr:hypothetical protein [Anaerolineaceae bacterium]
MENFFIKYWVEIGLSIVSILFGIFVSYIFYRLQKRDVVSAKEERVRRAIEELMDVLESYVINKQTFSMDTIGHLIAASERAHRVELNGVCTPTSLLQDVSLGLQKSTHLDVVQKAAYAEQIVKVIAQISGSEIKLPTSVKENLDFLTIIEKATQSGNKDLAIEKINNLRDSLKRLEPPIETGTSTRSYLTESIAIGLAGVLVAYMSLSDLLRLDTIEGFLLIYAFMIIFISVFILGTPQGRRVVHKMVNFIRHKD